MTRPRLTLIDGHALAYRQYHALSTARFATTQGEPTAATYGFARTLLDLLQAEPRTEYLAVVFDRGMSGREAIYADYKSTREKMPPEMAEQMPRIRELVEAFSIPILEKEGYEADDVIGTVAQQAAALGVDVHIITGDKDLLQLVNDHVTVELPGTRGGDAQVYDTAGVLEKMGVRPDQIPDYKGLVGDSSDNFPGVKGIGPKTALPLLQQYGSLEGIYEHLDEQKGAVLRNLDTGRASALLSRELATIRRDLPLEIDLQKCAAHEYDPAVVDALFQALEFNSLRKRLWNIAAGSRAQTGAQVPLFEVAEEPVAQVVRTITVDTEEALADLLRALETATLIAFDTEATSTDAMTADLVGISLAVSGDEGYYLPVGHSAPDAGTLLAGEPPRQLPLARVIEALRPALTDPNKPKAAHNAAYDLTLLRRYGLAVAPIAHDTMIAEWLLQPESQRKGLKEQARLRLGLNMTPIDELIGKGRNQITMDQVPVERAAPYAAADAAVTFRLVGATREDLERHALWKLFTEIEMPLVPIIVDINMTGAMLDLPYLKTLSQEFAERLNAIEAQIYESVGQKFNIGSPKQLNEIFIEKLGLPTRELRKSAHGYSLDAAALETLRDYHEAIGMILDWRALEKLKNTYVDALPRQVDAEGRVHTTYNQTGTVTGRISSESPNLQNIPIRTEEGRRVRRAFIAPPGCQLLGVDYSQIELRILAHFSKDEALLEAFRQEQDIHRATAALVYGIPFDQVTKEQRYFAKRVNFGLMYGMSAFRLARESDLSRAEAEEFVRKYFERLPGVRAYLENSKALAHEQGYLETLLGRRRDFSALKEGRLPATARARMEREAINMPIQGTAADIIKIAMIRLSERLKAEGAQARIILQVHDELVLEVPEADLPATTALVCEVMEGAYTLEAPLRADANIGPNWADMQPAGEWLAARR